MPNKNRMAIPVLVLIGFVAILSCCCPDAWAMIFKPHDGTLWDVSVLYSQGKYYAVMMHGKNEEGEFGWGKPRYIFLASSADGVHWEEEGRVIEEKALDTICGKPFVARIADRFILNHGTMYGVSGQFLRFYESEDLKTWTYLYTSQPDRRWYTPLDTPGTRWDHMYMIPKEQEDPSAGYWGYGVGVSKPGVVQGPMMMQSTNGRHWEILPPPEMEWGDVPPSMMEYSGCERIGGKYYLIGGNFIGATLGIERGAGYGVWTAISDDPRGPFRPDTKAHRLCGIQEKGNAAKNMVWLAAFARGKDNELLVSNSANIQRRTWMLPLRKAVVDSEGHLRLHWWPGNEALRGEHVPLKTTSVSLERPLENNKEYSMFELPEKLDVLKGFIFEGAFHVKEPTVVGEPHSRRHAVGFILPESEKRIKAIELGIGSPKGRASVIGILEPTDSHGSSSALSAESANNREFQFHPEDTTCDGFHATVTGVSPGEHTFRLLVRIGCFELYIDDQLMQTFFFEPGVETVGLFTRNADVVFRDLKIWHMSLPRSYLPFPLESKEK